MKRGLLIWLLFGLGVLPVSAQNDLFLGFPYSYARAWHYLDSLDYVRIVREVPERRLRAEANAAHFTYDFLGGWLFRVTMIRHFPNRKQARQAYKGVRTYFETVGVPPWRERSYSFVGAGKNELFDLQLKPGPGRSYALHLSARQPLYTPMTQWTPFDHRLAEALLRP